MSVMMEILYKVFGEPLWVPHSMLTSVRMVSTYLKENRQGEHFPQMYEMLCLLHSEENVDTIRFKIRQERLAEKKKKKEDRVAKLKTDTTSYSHPTKVIDSCHFLQTVCEYNGADSEKVEIKHPTFELYIENKSTTKVRLNVKHPKDGGINYFFMLLASGRFPVEMLSLFRNNASKEISESMAAVQWVNRQYECKLEDTLILCVGDGRTPRTGAVMASLFRSAKVISIDPESDSKKMQEWEKKFNVLCCAETIEEFLADKSNDALFQIAWKRIILVAVHSHAKLENYVPQICRLAPLAEVFVVAIPCCVQQSLDDQTIKECKLTELPAVVDFNIHSPMRHVIRFVRSSAI